MNLTRIAIIDVSNSMAEPFSAEAPPGTLARATKHKRKFDAAMDYLRFAIRKMLPNSQIFIIAFAESAEVVYQGSLENRMRIETALQKLEPKGEKANLGSAFELVLSLLDTRKYSVEMLDVFTDGLSNAGDPITPANKLRKKYGVFLHLYLIDPTEQGTMISRRIVGMEGKGDIYPIASGKELLDLQIEELRNLSSVGSTLDFFHISSCLSNNLFPIFPAALERPKVTAAYPQIIVPNEWRTMNIFIYLSAFKDVVQREVEKLRFCENVDYGATSYQLPRSLPDGCKITISLSSDTIRVNPSELVIMWHEPYNRLSFRISPYPECPIDTSATLNVDILVDDLLVASMKLPIAVCIEADIVPTQVSDAQWYENIFASYARKDVDFVRYLKERYAALGLDMFIDLDDLRSGVKWRPALFEKIDRSDLFQLFWSKTASKSKYVTSEWKRALEVSVSKGKRFIRPIYWEVPMPAVPKQLSDINFRQVTFNIQQKKLS